jgi:predicted dehydrogenase
MSAMVRIGILGAARITEKALIAPAREVASATVTAVAARGKARAEAFALRYGIPTSYGSYDELLADPAIDAVYVPLPNSLHVPWTLRAIAAGKHVLCEKPFASNAAEAAQVQPAAEKSGLVVMEAMHYRYHPLVREMESAIASGAIGTPLHAQCWTSWPITEMLDIRYEYALGGGALMDGGCYAIDCLRLAGLSEPEVTGALADPLPGAGRLVDRAMAASLTAPSGMTGWFESAFTRDGEFRADIHVIGDEGHLRLLNFINAQDGSLTIFPNEPSRRGAGSESSSDGDTTFTWQLRAFVAAVLEGEPFPTTVASAVTTMRVIDDTYRAAGLPAREATTA